MWKLGRVTAPWFWKRSCGIPQTDMPLCRFYQFRVIQGHRFRFSFSLVDKNVRISVVVEFFVSSTKIIANCRRRRRRRHGDEIIFNLVDASFSSLVH